MILLLSIAVSLFWLLGLYINVYSIPVVGAIFEILWLPAIALSILLPIAAAYFWIKESFRFKSAYFYSILILIAAVVLQFWLS